MVPSTLYENTKQRAIPLRHLAYCYVVCYFFIVVRAVNLSVVVLSVVILSVVMLDVVMLDVVKLSVVMLSVVAHSLSLRRRCLMLVSWGLYHKTYSLL